MLLRNSKHNNNTWGLPGGNADREDGGDLLQTAVREAIEEMTTLPEYEVVGKVHIHLSLIDCIGDAPMLHNCNSRCPLLFRRKRERAIELAVTERFQPLAPVWHVPD